MALDLPFNPPVEPMLAKAVDGLPEGDGWLFEPKWDGFRALVFRDGDEVYTQSRDLKPLDRYFPELADPLRAALPERCVLDGEVVIARDGALDFEALLLRIHPAASRVKMLAAESPGVVRRVGPARPRRRGPARVAAGRATHAPRSRARRRPAAGPPDPGDAATARPPPTGSTGSRAPGSTASSPRGSMRRTSPASGRCSRSSTSAPPTASSPGSAGTRTGPGTHIGSLLLGLFDDAGTLHHVGDHVVVHLGPPRGARRGAGAAARERARRPPVARMGRVGHGRATPMRPASACRARRRAGTAARTCRGSRCAPSGSSRSPTTTSRATASATRRRSSAGVRTSRRRRAATTSSRRACRSSSRRSSGAERGRVRL